MWIKSRPIIVLLSGSLVAGCSLQQPLAPTISSAGSYASPRHTVRSSSTDDALMYPSAKGSSYVVSYPQGKLVGTIDAGAYGLCSDAAGNVFIPAGSSVSEFAHGSTKISAMLPLPSEGFACAVDPATNTLAVTVYGSPASSFSRTKAAPEHFTVLASIRCIAATTTLATYSSMGTQPKRRFA